MEKIIKQLKNAAKDTRLSAVEKAAIKSQLLHYVKTHPSGGVVTSYVHASPSPFSIQNFRNKKTLSAFVIGGLLVGSTVSFAAENTVPGDALYSVKIHINEPILSAVAVTPQAKADWEVSKAERRLVEIEKLATAATPSLQVKAAAEENFNATTKQVRDRIAGFENDNDNEDALRTAGRFADMLRKHEGEFNKSGFNEIAVSPEIASSSVESATSLVQFVSSSTTSQLPSSEKKKKAEEVKRGKFDDVLMNIRDARGNAERIEKDLHVKYDKERVQAENFSSSGIATTTPAELGNSRSNSGSSFDKQGRGKGEELHATPASDDNSSQVREGQNRNND